MDWSRRNSSGAVAHPNNQQYLPQSTSSTVPNMPNNMASVQSNSYNSAQIIGKRSPLLKDLLGARTDEDLLRVQLSALSKPSVQQTMQISPGTYNSSFSPRSKTAPTRFQSSHNVQNPVTLNYQIPVYQNSVLQTLQQAQSAAMAQQQAQSAAMAQQQAQSAAMAQQQAQSAAMAQQQAQSAAMAQQQAQSAAMAQQQAQSAAMAQQQAQSAAMAQQQAQSAAMAQQQAKSAVAMAQQQAQSAVAMAQQQAQPLQRYDASAYNTREVQQSLQTTQSGGYSKRRSHHMTNSNVARRHSQNDQIKYQSMIPKASSQNSVSNATSGPYVGSYKAVNEKNVSISTSNCQNGQTILNHMGLSYQTASHSNALQLLRNINMQRQIMSSSSSGFSNNSSNVLSSATVGQVPLLQPQSNISAPNIGNVSVNQIFSNPNQNFVAQNTQQPTPSFTVPKDQHSAPPPQHSVQPPPYNANVPQDQRSNIQDLAAFLNVYQNVRQKYLLLNRENNILRQKIQSSSQGNSGSCPVKPPLLSSLVNWTIPANDPMGRQEVSQNSTAKSQPSANATHGVQTPTLYENSFSSHVYPIIDSGFDSGRINHGSTANCSGQVPASETLRSQDPQKTSMVAIQANNQYYSGGNSSNGNLSQGGLFISTVQSLAQTETTTSDSCNLVPTRNASNLYANDPLSSSAREAIQATLSLWKSDPQSSAQNKSGQSEPKQHMVNKTLETIRFLEEMVSNSVNVPNAVTLMQKLEHSAPNVSKGIKPHVAIVSPLVQIKDLVNEISQHPKVLPHGEDVANNVFKENEYFNELNLPLESGDVAKNKREGVQPRSSMVSSLPCNVDQNSTETADENLQISGICTLVEGNSYYDSSVAMMFAKNLQTESGSLLATTDLNDCIPQCSREDVICGTSQASSDYHTTESVAVKLETQENIETCVSMEDDQKRESVYGLDTQSGQNLSSSVVFNAESNDASDQLSELLTEFPFGIKNYMSENKLENTNVSLGKLTEKLKPLKSPVPLFDKSIMGVESAVDTLTKEMETPKTKLIDQLSVVKSEPASEVPINEVTSEQLEDDCFEVSDSPDSNIHITLVDQDQIPEFFPENSPEPVMHSEESVVDRFAKESEAPVLDVAASSKNEKADDESASDKELFCCLFSWLTHTNGNAPKCNCKLTELGETEELSNNFSQPASANKTEPSTDGLDPSRDGRKPSTDGLDSSTDTCKTQLDRKNEEIHPPAMKCSKFEPVETTLKSKHANCRPQEEIKEKLESAENTSVHDQYQKELRKSETLTSERLLQSKSHLGDSNSKSIKDPFPGCKSNDVDGPQKLEKLIIRTDFLKNRHLLKMKRKYKEMKSSRAEEDGGRSVQKISKNTDIGKSAKTLNMDRLVGGKAKNEECKSPTSTVQPPEKSMNKLEPSSSSDKSHSRNQASSMGKRKERVKIRSESHFEKVKRVPSVQEYLERKRELCSKRYGPKEDQRDEPADARHSVLEKSSMDKSGTNLLPKMLRPSIPTEINVKTKKNQSGDTYKAQKGRPKNIGTSESVRQKHRGPPGSHGKGSLVNKEQEKKINSNKEKIYLAPCDGSRRASCEGISLTKLQIRHSPIKPGYLERRSSVDSNVYSKQSKSETKNKEAPKMLEFKLCPEFVSRSPSLQERKEPKASKEKRTIEGIKSRKEAWCSGGPPKKSRIDGSSEDQGRHSPQSTSSFKWTQKNSSRPVQDSRATFNVFKQRYQEQRSKSMDGSV